MADQLPSGVKLSSGKLMWRLLPWDVARDVVAILTWACTTKVPSYPPDGWRTVQGGIDKYSDAAERHLVEWRLGVRVDHESGLPTLAHAICDLMIVHALELAQARLERADPTEPPPPL